MQRSFNIAHLSGYFELLSEQNIKLNDILKGSKINKEVSNNPATLINFDQQKILLGNIFHLNNDPALGFKVGAKRTPACFGIPMQAVLSSPNLITSFHKAQRLEYLYAAHSQIRLHSSIRNKNCYILKTHYLSELKITKALITEVGLSAISLAADTMTGKSTPLKLIRLNYKKPQYHSLYEDYFNCPVEFNAGTTEIWVDSDIAHTPSTLRNPSFSDYAEKISLSNEAQPLESINFINKVVGAINSHPSIFPSLDETASILCMSGRTLHRKLDRCDTSFLRISNGIKLSYAENYILKSNLSLDEIALKTGFSSGNSFRVAFTNWTNLTPSAFRTKHKAVTKHPEIDLT